MLSSQYCTVCQTVIEAEETIESGEIVCTKCGTILSGTILDERLSFNEGVHLNRPATVFATNLSKRPKVAGITGQQIAGERRSRQKWRKQMRSLSVSVNLGANQERAWYLFTQCLDGDLRIRSRILMCASCILYVLRESSRSMSLADLAVLVNSSVTSLGKAYAQTEQYLKQLEQQQQQQQQQVLSPPLITSSTTTTKVNATDPSLFIPSKLSQLRDVAVQHQLPLPDPLLAQNARILLMFMARSGLITGRRPDTLAVVAILFALEAQLGYHLDKDLPNRVTSLSKAMGVAVSTVQRSRQEHKRVLLNYLCLLPDLVEIKKLGPRQQQSVFYSSLNTLIQRWQEIVKLADDKQLDTTAAATATHELVDTTSIETLTSSRLEANDATDEPSASALAQLATPVSRNTNIDMASLPSSLSSSSSYAIPVNEPPLLNNLHMVDRAAPSFKRINTRKSKLSANRPSTITIQHRSIDAMMSTELNDQDLTQEEETAYIRTPSEIQLFNHYHNRYQNTSTDE
ncbi:hypothetical protein BDF19DRAFT_423457 [Syncephalis fuscata]|nr:hypothetical protein BDF19DRAFT_423457 [Syncephalis fuscata]